MTRGYCMYRKSVRLTAILARNLTAFESEQALVILIFALNTIHDLIALAFDGRCFRSLSEFSNAGHQARFLKSSQVNAVSLTSPYNLRLTNLDILHRNLNTKSCFPFEVVLCCSLILEMVLPALHLKANAVPAADC